MKKIGFLSAIALSIFIVGCNDDDTPTPDPITTESVFIANEGVFPNGVGSITNYNPNSNTTNNNIFQKANIYAAGAVINSIYVDGNRLWIVVNADGVVYVVNSDTYLVEAKFENLQSPREVIRVSENRYWISDWGINGVHVVNPNNGRIVKELKTGFGPENMLLHEDKVFITNRGGFFGGAIQKDSTVTVYDAVMDTLITTIEVGENPNSLQMDNEGKLWVLSEGIEDLMSPTSSTFGYLHSINVDSLWVEDTLEMPNNQLRPNQLGYSQAKDRFYFLGNEELSDLMMVENGASTVSDVPFIPGSFYAFGFDNTLNQIYLADKLTEGDAGRVSRHQEDGTLMNRFSAGQNPTDFDFKTNR